MILPSVGVFFIGYLMMGFVASLPEVKNAGRKPTAILPSRKVVSGFPPEAAMLQWQKTFDDWANAPEVCKKDKAVNDFQRQQCDAFWEQFQIGLAVSLIPFLLVLAFLMVGLDLLVSIYRKARKKFQTGEAAFSGIVTEPAQVPKDGFAWFHCLTTVAVKLETGQQMKVYLPAELPIPRPGQTLAVFDVGKVLGQKRHLAIVYAPHVVIVSGGRA